VGTASESSEKSVMTGQLPMVRDAQPLAKDSQMAGLVQEELC